VEKHVHCGRCGAAIATRVKDAGGSRRDAKIAVGYQWRISQNAAGMLEPVQVEVPLCGACHPVVEAEEVAAKAEALEAIAAAQSAVGSGRLVVAGAGAVPKAPL
jgi:predicted PP-loop superfamily ATPase